MQEAANILYGCGPFTVMPAARRLLRHGEDVELEAKVLDLIVLLVEHRERTLSKDEIVGALWGSRPVTDAALSQLVYKARRIFDRDETCPSVIRTVYGRGLQWAANVEVIAEPTLPDPGDAAPPLKRPARAWPRRAAWAGIAMLVVAGLIVSAIHYRALQPPTTLPRIVMLPLDNATGDAALDWARHGIPGLVASLLGDSHGMDVVDPAQVARIWEFERPAGQTRVEHLRRVTAADVLVSTRLRRLAKGLYELDVHVDAMARGKQTDIALTGSDGGNLGVAAVPRILRALGLQPRTRISAKGALPGDAYVAETFARGIDLAVHGDWAGARPYFALVATGDPDFLPGRLRLGQAQINTEQPEAAKVTLQALLAQADQDNDAPMQARALLRLAELELIEHDFSTALQRLQRALPLASQAHDNELELDIALKAANAASRLQRTQTAQQMLAHARHLLEANHLLQRAGDLHNSEAFLAQAMGDGAAAERADRAALEASEAIGNTHNALIDAYNLALVLLKNGRSAEALPLFLRTYQRARDTHFTALVFSTGDNLSIALLNAGLDRQAALVARQLQQLGVREHNTAWQALALLILGGQASYAGDSHASLEHCDAAAALIDGAQDPDLMIATRVMQGTAALLAAPERLPDLMRRTDELVAAQTQSDRFRYNQLLVQALAAAAGGQANRANALLRAARSAPHPDDATLDNLRSVGLSISLSSHNDAEAAALALQGFDPEHSDNADLLRLVQAWSERRGDEVTRDQASRRRQQLIASAATALQGTVLSESNANY